MIKSIFAGALLLAVAGGAAAWDHPATPTSYSAFKGRAAKAVPLEFNTADLMTPPTGAEAFVDGAVYFTHAGREYAFKAIFSRAFYDAGLGTYKTGLRYQLSDYTDIENVSFWVPIDPEKFPVADYHNNFDGTQFHIVSGERQVEITAVTNGKSKKYKFYVKTILDSWERAAELHFREIAGDYWFFVPQVVWQPRDGIDYYSRSYAISGETPLDDATGLPLDAVRICTSQDYWDGCEMPAFAVSMATGLRLDTLNDASGALEIEPLTVEFMRGTAQDELEGNCWHYNCESEAHPFNNW